MCGRLLFSLDIDEVMQSFSIEDNFSENIEKGEKFPGTKIPIILSKNNKTNLTELSWGIKYGSKLIINSKFETVEEKPLFKGLLEYSRCIVPASSYYEWMLKGKSKEKMEIYYKNKTAMAFAGLCGTFKNGESDYYEAVVILTVPAGKEVEDIHPRMPLTISKDMLNYWLDSNITKIDKSKILQKHYSQSFAYENCEGIQQISFL